jgi:hypothetical protein
MSKSRYRTDFNLDEVYPQVIGLVERGFTIVEALNKADACRWTFYHKMSAEQKARLKQIKVLGSMCNHVHRLGGGNGETLANMANKDFVQAFMEAFCEPLDCQDDFSDEED